MSGIVLTQLTTSAQISFALRVGGRIYTRRSPVGGSGPGTISFTQSGEAGPGRCQFTIEDTDSSVTLSYGAVVEIVDRRSGSDVILWGGHLVEASVTPTEATIGRTFSCTAIAYDAWLDWRIIPRWRSTTDVQKRINKISSDRAMVSYLADKYGGPILNTNAFIDETNANMPNVSVLGMTLRDAIQAIADAATTRSDTTNRWFYVDNYRRLHYYKDTENLAAPYMIGDASYVRDVLDTSGLVAFWPMRESSGADAQDAKAYANGTLAGTYVRNVTGGVVNEPAMRATTLDGTTGYMSATGAALHPGSTSKWTIELWFKRNGYSSAQVLWSGGTGDIEIGFDVNNKLYVSLEGTGVEFQGAASWTDSAWHHLVVTRDNALAVIASVYVDGALTGYTSSTVRTFTGGSGTIEIGRKKSTSNAYASATVQMIALYNVILPEATVEAHYYQGISIIPQNLTVTYSAYEGREAIYILGANAAGSGWVRAGRRGVNVPRLTEFGGPDLSPERQMFIEREDSNTEDKLDRYGGAYLRNLQDPQVIGQFTVVGYDGWYPGQLIYVSNAALGLSLYPAEIREVSTDVLMGNGVMAHDITFGRARTRGTRRLKRRRDGR